MGVYSFVYFLFSYEFAYISFHVTYFVFRTVPVVSIASDVIPTPCPTLPARFLVRGENIVIIYHGCEGCIDKSVPEINFWHHKAS